MTAPLPPSAAFDATTGTLPEPGSAAAATASAAAVLATPTRATQPAPGAPLPTAAVMLEVVVQISTVVMTTAPLGDRLERAAELIRAALQADGCVVRELVADELVLMGVAGIPRDRLPVTLSPHQGIAAQLISQGESLVVHDVPQNAVTARLHANTSTNQYQFGAFAGSPMLIHGECLGVLGVYADRATRQFNQGDLQYLQLVANHLAAALHNHRLYHELRVQKQSLEREVEQRILAERLLQGQLDRADRLAVANQDLLKELREKCQEVTRAYDTTLEGWCAALDLRDAATQGHTLRVTRLTEQLARHLGCSEAELQHIRRGALLHDIGKIGIPDSILLKPGPLDSMEWAMMRRHPEMAMEMLETIEFLQPALAIPACHHERWDGAGYPHGLAATDIPFAARVFAVVDVYDALTSDRPYRSAWSHEEAIDYIESQSGGAFDPHIVQAFLQLNNF